MQSRGVDAHPFSVFAKSEEVCFKSMHGSWGIIPFRFTSTRFVPEVCATDLPRLSGRSATRDEERAQINPARSTIRERTPRLLLQPSLLRWRCYLPEMPSHHKSHRGQSARSLSRKP